MFMGLGGKSSERSVEYHSSPSAYVVMCSGVHSTAHAVHRVASRSTSPPKLRSGGPWWMLTVTSWRSPWNTSTQSISPPAGKSSATGQRMTTPCSASGPGSIRMQASHRPYRCPGCQLMAPVVPSAVAVIVATPSRTLIASGVRTPFLSCPTSGP